MPDMPMFEREYDVEGYDEKISLQIFEPRPADTGGWECNLWMEAPLLGWRKTKTLPGDDKLDAFASALIMATIDLRHLGRRYGASVTFQGDDNIDLIDRDYY